MSARNDAEACWSLQYTIVWLSFTGIAVSFRRILQGAYPPAMLPKNALTEA